MELTVPRRALALVIAVVVLVIGLFSIGSIFENVDAGEILVVQDVYDGELHWYPTAGYKPQWFGKVTKYHKRSQFWFSSRPDQGNEANQSLQVRFNDKGHAKISGSLAWEMPISEEHLTMLHTKYGSQEAIEQQLIRTVVEKAVYMTGPLMSSQESAAERRNELLQFIEDQVANGVYRTETVQEKQADPVTGQQRTVSIVKLVMEGGKVVRSDESPLKTFGIRTFNPSINEVAYDPTVEAQIQEQQKATMAVQTSMANAKKAEQDAITVAKNGEALAAKAKWDQEVIKATAVTKAQQELEVATLAAKAAEQTKRENILLGEGEAERKRLVMNADGALDLKLKTWLDSQKVWADAFAKHQGPMVPNVVSGSGGGGANAAINANTMIEVLGVKALKDLSLDMTMTQGAKARK
ncbi:MAG: SPFH domain-containing protein [bacterium]|nr:SPFH domain-containing protein [bacterium]